MAGATTSTCRLPEPAFAKGGTVSSLTVTVPAVSAAPTARTYGSCAGLARLFTSRPSFPAAATTTMPLRQALSTAKASGSTCED
jgi:hypothetical protein